MSLQIMFHTRPLRPRTLLFNTLQDDVIVPLRRAAALQIYTGFQCVASVIITITTTEAAVELFIIQRLKIPPESYLFCRKGSKKMSPLEHLWSHFMLVKLLSNVGSLCWECLFQRWRWGLSKPRRCSPELTVLYSTCRSGKTQVFLWAISVLYITWEDHISSLSGEQLWIHCPDGDRLDSPNCATLHYITQLDRY